MRFDSKQCAGFGALAFTAVAVGAASLATGTREPVGSLNSLQMPPLRVTEHTAQSEADSIKKLQSSAAPIAGVSAVLAILCAVIAFRNSSKVSRIS